MHKYSLMQIKENLPEILDLIKFYKKTANVHLWLYYSLISSAYNEDLFPQTNYGWWTTEKSIFEAYKCYRQDSDEVKYLECLIQQLKNNSTTLSA